MVAEIVRMVSMNPRIVDHRIEHVQLASGNAIMVDASAPINDAMESMIAGKRRHTVAFLIQTAYWSLF